MDLKTIKINKINYVECDKVLELAPIYSKGSKNTRSLVRDKKIDADMYIYAKKNGENKWIVSDGKSIKFDKVLLKQSFIETIPELNRKKGDEIKDENGVKEAPPIIILEDGEKFKDNEGNVLEIETRGDRTCNGTYFKVADVSLMFGLDNLKIVISDRGSSYTINDDFIFFFTKNNLKKENKKNIIKKEMYLTYEGILKVIFISRKGKTSGFIKWATETLFTAQMGTREQKEDMVSGILGIPAITLRQVLSSSSKNIPCIYMFALGTCEDLRKIMKIPNDVPNNHVIIKYGFTDDLVRRTNEHMKTYNVIKGVKLELLNYAYVDPKYLSAAETDVKGYFESIETPLVYEKYAELVSINPKHKKQISNQFKFVTDQYAGIVSNLIQDIENQKTSVAMLKKDHQLEIQMEQHKTEKQSIINEKQMAINEKQMAINEKQLVIIEKMKVEIENRDLKLQIAKMNES